MCIDIGSVRGLEPKRYPARRSMPGGRAGRRLSRMHRALLDCNDEEVAAHPDPASCTVQPWQPEVAWFASDLWYEGKPFDLGSTDFSGVVQRLREALGLNAAGM